MVQVCQRSCSCDWPIPGVFRCIHGSASGHFFSISHCSPIHPGWHLQVPTGGPGVLSAKPTPGFWRVTHFRNELLVHVVPFHTVDDSNWVKFGSEKKQTNKSSNILCRLPLREMYHIICLRDGRACGSMSIPWMPFTAKYSMTRACSGW